MGTQVRLVHLDPVRPRSTYYITSRSRYQDVRHNPYPHPLSLVLPTHFAAPLLNPCHPTIRMRSDSHVNHFSFISERRLQYHTAQVTFSLLSMEWHASSYPPFPILASLTYHYHPPPSHIVFLYIKYECSCVELTQLTCRHSPHSAMHLIGTRCYHLPNSLLQPEGRPQPHLV